MKNKMENKMEQKPVYEIVKILKHKVFIVGLDDISLNLEFVYKELNEQFPNKRIIFIDNISDMFGDSLEWWEILEDMSTEDKSSPTGYEILIGQYTGKIPNLTPWNKILNYRVESTAQET